MPSPAVAEPLGALDTSSHPSAAPSRARTGWAIFLAFFAFYLLTSGRERPWGDATPVWQVADSLVDHGGVDTPSRWPYTAPAGRNGKYYASNPLIGSLIHVPGALVRRALHRVEPLLGAAFWPLACHLGPAACGALTCVLVFLLALELGLSRRAALLTTLAVGLASPTWIYARSPYTEAVQTACFTGLLLSLVRLDGRRPVTVRAAVAAGGWAALLLNTKLLYALCLPPAAVLLVLFHRRDRAALRSLALGTLPAAFAGVLLAFVYNVWRWGLRFEPAYTSAPVFPRGKLWVGAWGLLLSPGKSLFLYAPPLVVAVLGARDFGRRAPRAAAILLATILPVFLLYAKFPFWHGDFAWGPRYLVFACPVLLLPLGFWIDRPPGAARAWLRPLVLGAALCAGVVVQIAGSAFYWDHFIRLSLAARPAWLGAANRQGAIGLDPGGQCHVCVEDLYQLHWLPAFQPIRGHLWLLRHVPFGHSWVVAEADAPWHPETTLTLPIAPSYARARVDWWWLELPVVPRARVVALVLMLALLGAGLALALPRQRVRRGADTP